MPVKAGLGDVLLAAFVCSSPHARSRKNLSRRWRLNWFLKRWAKAVNKFDAPGQGPTEESQERRTAILIAETRKFFAYWNECLACPELETDKDSKVSGGSPQAPNEWTTLATLMADFHLTRRAAYNTELAWAAAIWAANAARSGRSKLRSQEASLGDEAAFRRAQELTRAKEAACSA